MQNWWDWIVDWWNSVLAYFASVLGPFSAQDYLVGIIIIPAFILLYFLYLVTIRSIKIGFKRVGMPREATGGVVFGVRLVFFFLAFLAILALAGEVLQTYAITVGALFGTAIGFAFSKALSNMVSGLYVLAARPFRVGDYIRIGDSEGIVLEITLNYTRILRPDHTRQYLPNVTMVDSRLTNFRVRIDDYLSERGIEYHHEDDDDKDSRIENALEKIKNLTRGDEVFRYTFDVEIARECSRSKIERIFHEVCKNWNEKFIQEPEFIFWNSTATTITYRFAFMVIEPKDIMTLGTDFRSEVSSYPSTS
ncbi:MAG: hypothetical protein EAX81_08520 [Candidatus Thorarchaeota archaeon]|nr:hypothetical protein [Candidatus Thorarchaeota archaeon]